MDGKKATRIGLKKEYVPGSQMWLPRGRKLARDTQVRGFGCGLVAALDFAIYQGAVAAPGDREEYRERLRQMSRLEFPIMPGLGIAPYYYPLLVNHYFRKYHIPYRLQGSFGARNIEQCAGRIRSLLKEDLPVLFAAGPVYPWLRKKRRIRLYVKERGILKDSGKSVQAHYMTVVGMERDQSGEYWIKVASWGDFYYISLREYARHGKSCFPYTNRFYRAGRLSAAEKT